MEQKNPPDKYKQIITALPNLLPICYIVMVCVGMVFNYFKFKCFGINVFQYATIFDFLISPFEDPNIIWFILLSSIIPISCIIIDLCWKRHFPTSYKKWNTFGLGEKGWFQTYQRATYFILCIIYIFLFAFYYGIYTKVQTSKQTDITVLYSDNELISGKQIGKVGNTLFLLCDKEVKIIPTEAYVKRITIPLREKD